MRSDGQGILGRFARQFSRLASAFREKPEVVLDEYLLEHFMLYHGLVGTSPHDQPRVRDVRADISDALKYKSPFQLGVALKLPPLWWEDKLAAMFDEFRQTREQELLSCLLPEVDPNAPPENDPLRHPDWRVRANAARMLGHLGVKQAAPRMVAALQEVGADQKAGYLHIAYGLGKLRNEEARRALESALSHEEPWFRVDAAGALAYFPAASVAQALAGAFTKVQPLNDYMAVAAARRLNPAVLLADAREPVREAGLEMVIGLVEACGGPAGQDVPYESQLHKCLSAVAAAAAEQPTPRRLRAASLLACWILENLSDIRFYDREMDASAISDAAVALRDKVGAREQQAGLLEWLRRHHQDYSQGSQLKHACRLSGQFGTRQAAPYVVALARPLSPVVNEAVEALAALAQPDTAAHLVQLASELVDLKQRTERALSKQPVFEDNPEAARTYWQVLKALSRLPGEETARCLLTASHDFAADKRQQALDSLIAVSADAGVLCALGEPVKKRLSEALGDPSPSVRATALKGVGELQVAQLLPEVMRLTQAREPAICRQAELALKKMHEGSHALEVEKVLQAGISGERDRFRRQRLQTLLQSLKP